MLSAATKDQLARLYRQQNVYHPDEAIVTQLVKKAALVFVSPTCMGKNTVMEAIAGINDRFHVAGTFTSREPRTSDVNYIYYENSDRGLRSVLQAIENHEVVNYAVNPYAHTLYGSQLKDYPSEYNMADIFSSAVDQFRQLGFQRVLAISIITDPTVWLRRFEERFPPNHPQRRARRDEAIESLNWSLTETSKDHYWVKNVDGQPEVAAGKAIAIATEGANGDDDAHLLMQACLEVAKEIAV